jgi:hypothetical protein
MGAFEIAFYGSTLAPADLGPLRIAQVRNPEYL